MFGYIRVLEGELKINDFGIYRGVYCGLCKTMKNNTGITSPFTLTYDFVLLALVRSAINGEGFTVRPGKCIAHPIKKRPMAHENEALRFCSAVSAVLTYYKLLDDKNDKDTKKRLIVCGTLRQARRNMRKAIRNFPQYDLDALASSVSELLSELAELENTQCSSADRCADVFGRLLAKCFAHCIEDEQTASNCSSLGYHIGRWIYLIDLCDDFYKDKKKNAYNPLLFCGLNELPEMMLRASLTRETEQAYIALKSLEIKYTDIYRILENIICLGMPNAVKVVFEKNQKKQELLEAPKQ